MSFLRFRRSSFFLVLLVNGEFSNSRLVPAAELIDETFRVCAFSRHSNYTKYLASGGPFGSVTLERVPHAFLEISRSDGRPFSGAFGYYPENLWGNFTGTGGLLQQDRREASDTLILCKERVPGARIGQCMKWLLSYDEVMRPKYRLPREWRSPPSLATAGIEAAPPQKLKAEPYMLWGHNCAEFVKAAWSACAGENLEVGSYFFASDPTKLRRAP